MTARGTNLPRVKKQNEALIKEIIYKYGPISRSKIAEMLSLTPPTITTNVSSLIERGLVYEFAAEDSDVEERSLGRKPIKINFIQNARYAVGVEMNPYQTAICMLDLRGNEKISMKYPPMNGVYVEEMDMLARNIDKLISESGVDPEKILGVGMGLPGFVESKVGILRESFKTGWNNKNIARDLSRRLDIPVLIENNARARAIGEEMFGKTLRPDSFAYYLISYGIACPLFVKNRMITGENASAGEAGHMVVDINGPKCETCGHNGCLEEMASERAILKKCKAAVNDGNADGTLSGHRGTDHEGRADGGRVQRRICGEGHGGGSHVFGRNTGQHHQSHQPAVSDCGRLYYEGEKKPETVVGGD